MKLQEAVKSGKDYKRIDQANWYSPHDVNFNHISVADAIATDWIIKERTITITESEFDDAYRRAQMNFRKISPHANRRLTFSERLKLTIGFPYEKT